MEGQDENDHQICSVNGSGFSGDTALEQDAQLYAARFNVSLSEALFRLSLQPLIGDLQDQLATEQEGVFGGLWIQHTPQFRVIIQLTAGDANSISPYVSGGPLWGLTDVQLVKNSYRELEILQVQTQRKMERDGIMSESGINTLENRVEIFVLAGQMEASRKILSEVDSDSVMIKIVEGLSIPTTDIYAGLGLATCTSGFSVQDSFGVRGITTAAHCNNSQSFNGTNLPLAGERFGGRNDVQWHTAPGLIVRNWARDENVQDSTPFYRYITSTRHRKKQVINEWVCKYGSVSGYNCGYIIDRSYRPTNSIPNATANYIRVHSDYYSLAAPGDSGGPWYSGNTAYGIMTAGFDNNPDAVYMAANFIKDLGVTVLVQ